MKPLKVIALSALMSVTLAAHASDQNPLGTWDLDDPAWDYQSDALIDTAPQSRAYVARYLSNKFNIAMSRLSNANRVHAELEFGKADLSDEAVEDINKLLDKTKGSAEIYIIGFASEEGEYEVNRKLADKRSRSVASVVKSHEKDFGRMRKGYSAAALSKGGEGQRAEIWIVRSFD
jgi:outer membrane protein OmpA-like peptidoglycan-associated protein